MKKLILILVIIIIGGGIWWWQQQPKTEEKINKNYNDWLNYNTASSSNYSVQDLKHPFSFKYPADLKISETKGGISVASEGMREDQKMWIESLAKCDDYHVYRRLSCHQRDDFINVEEWCSKDYKGDKYSQILATNTISDNTYSIDYKTSRGDFRKVCLTENNEDFVNITYPLDSEILDIYNSIVSIFEFKK